ncbi:MAG: rRNA pseudouridine synthase [Alphaproteobacteria bacterium]|nr:rRNA pseudouridine synthase [Alphaproteobacteria bacterium]
MKIRIAKFIADSGVTSRRGAEALIAAGVVAVNGEVVKTPVHFVEETDTVTINGRAVERREKTRVFAFHKPIDTMTTTRDPHGRNTIYDILPPEYRNLRYVGRLDYKTTGLLLMTNDGLLARKLTQPSSKVPRVYLADVIGNNMSRLDRARRGMTVDGIKYQPMQIEIMRDRRLRITITEGKKNEIRIVLKACGLPVRTLHRVMYGPVSIKSIPSGKIIELDEKTIDVLVKTSL